MSRKSLRRDIESVLEDENIELTELIGEAIDNLLDIIEEEEDRQELDMGDEEDDD